MNRKTIRYISICFVALLISILALTVQAQTTTAGDNNFDISGIYTDTILDEADIIVSENDKVVRTDGKGCIALTIIRAFEVKVDYRGQVITAQCTEGTVADAIKKAGITLTGAEEIVPPVNTPLTPMMEIKVTSNCSATVTIGGETEVYNVSSGTVADLISDLGVTVDEDDEVYPALTDVIYDGIEVVVRKVEYKEETKTETIDYGYVSENTSSMLTGTSKIKQYGIEGERTVTCNNKYIDGELAESVVIREEVTREPVDQIKLIGTGVPKTQSNSSSSSSSSGASVSNKAGTFKDVSGNTVSYVKKLTGTSTAYYAAEGAITATGVPVYLGGVAVNPNVIPYGSKLYIVSSDGRMVYGYATAVDTGGALMSGSVLVDVFYPTYNQCMNWGRRNVTVYVLS
ncbi:MAG: DUF348 domain-containing protein [Ruminococcaceae bacterium]|nr:DUF348 domain-containing protein [Oscillospiraceae bacterium]